MTYQTINPIRAIMKLMMFMVISVSVVTGLSIRAMNATQQQTDSANSQVLLSFPMKETNWKDIGVVSEPLITLPIKTPDGYKDNKFLLDSGAVISSLPREWADTLGYDLAFLPRSTFGGFGGTTSTAYQGEMQVRLGSEDVILPVVFTEAVGVKSLLGRKEFFNRYSITFDHLTNQVQIRK